MNAAASPSDCDFADEPLIDVEEIPKCQVCGTSEGEYFTIGYDYEIRTCGNAWKILRCKKCDHLWLNPRPAISELNRIYPKTYYAYDFEHRVNPIALKGKAVLDAIKLSGIIRQLGKSQVESYVDIGCGSGRFLRTMKARGTPSSRIYGLELNEEVIVKLRSEGFQAFAQRVEDCDAIPLKSIDLATMFHVIEHVDDPLAVVRRVGEWLKPDGIFAIETPNADSLDARLFKNRFWGGYHIPRHWNIFTPRSLRELLERAGFEVLRLQYQTGHSFWMYSLHHCIRYGRLKNRRLSQWFDPLRGLPFLIFFTAFDKLRALLGCRTSSMLVIARTARTAEPSIGD